MTNELYRSVSPSIQSELCQYEEHVTVATGATLIEHGTIPDHVMIVEEGRVEIVLLRPQQGELKILGYEGQILGVRPIVTGTPEIFDVRAIEACAITRIRGDIFLGVLNRHPELYFAIARLLSKDVNSAERFLREARLAPNKALVQMVQAGIR